jgi:predicted DNA-binding protein YlxM (UPF0122 family)
MGSLEEFIMKKIIISRKKLVRLYEDKQLSTYTISKILKCDPTVIQKRLKEYKIEIRYPKKAIKTSKKLLENLYINKGLSTYKIAKIMNCGPRTVYSKLVKYNIKTRPIKRVPIQKERLIDLYHNKKLSYSKIAEKYSCSPSIIFDKMKDHKITTRSLSEACTIYPKKDFSGYLIEKAYLIGFRLGDLNVKRDHKLIKVKTNTTKIEQVNLLHGIFREYGKPNIKEDKNGVFRFEILLNKSFSFLLPKKDNVEDWILRKDKYFLAFLAGYIDAEGNIGVYSSRARLRIRSYDKNLLRITHKKLKTLNIHSIYKLEAIAGKYNQNQDMWGVSINKKQDLLRILKLIKPFMKHQKRCEDLKTAEENILLRIRRNKNG